PTVSDAALAPIFDSGVWESPLGLVDAPLAEGRFPLLLVSHGMFGNSRNQGWLASALAAKGWIVAMPNHPGTTSFNRDPALMPRLSERPRDLSRLLDALVADAAWADALDLSRVAAAGHSLGGYTVMRLAGARHDPVRQREICAGVPERVDCAALAELGAGVEPAGDGELSADRSDARIRAVIALDLGGTQIFAPESLAAIHMPVLILGAERGDMLDQDLESRALAAALQDRHTRFIEMDGVGHFDFLGICTEAGYAILAKDAPGDEMVCEDGIDNRRTRQATAVGEILGFLQDQGF
ncbi:MAG: alpha/beta fold hydrolase, partial [Pseudomonadota bacterium]